MAKTRVASTVLVTRPGDEGTEVLLVDRAPQLRFFGGYMALPGGVIEIEDATQEAELLNDCAHRELFEETGILAASVASSVGGARSAIRQALLDGDLAPWRTALPVDGLPELREFCRMTTPPFAPVRYATTFYHLELPPGEKLDVWPGELTGAGFWRPDAALRAWYRGEALIVPPVLFLLELLEAASDLSEFFARAADETRVLSEGRLHPVRFSPGIFVAALEAKTKPPATTTNAFLVGVERMFVVDPAPTAESERERLFERIDAARAGGATVEGVLLTHYHPDHVGAAAATCERYGVPLLAHEATFERLPDAGTGRTPLTDGDRLELGTAPDGTPGWQLEVVETPGHAPGHLAFVESRYRAAIVGDLLSTLSTVVIDPDEGHMGTYLASLEKLRDLGIGTVYPGHGPAFRDGVALISRALAHRKKREDRIVSALRSEAQPIDALLTVVYDDVDERIHHLALKSLAAGLIKLREDGRAVETEGGWKLA